jgi:hypothetical protein
MEKGLVVKKSSSQATPQQPHYFLVPFPQLRLNAKIDQKDSLNTLVLRKLMRTLKYIQVHKSLAVKKASS